MSALPLHRRRGGAVLVIVLFFVLLLAASMATFLRRVAVDAGVAHNRDAARRADALARGGVRIAEALLIEDLRVKGEEPRPDSLHDLWGRVRDVDLAPDEDAILRLEIDDTGALVNLNTLLFTNENPELAETYLTHLFAKVIEEMEGRPEEKLWDPDELYDNLLDWVDEDDVRQGGGNEDSYYQSLRPPYRAANRPLLSVDELALVEGFDARLVNALRHYVTVYPFVGGEEPQINLNTAPPWVLATLLQGQQTAAQQEINEDTVRRILDTRESLVICDNQEDAGEGCMLRSELLAGDTTYPRPLQQSVVFRVRSVARVGDVERSVETYVDRAVPSQPLRLSWRVE